MTGTALLIAAMQQATLSGVVRDSVEPGAGRRSPFARWTVSAVAGEAAAVVGVSDRYGAFVVPGVEGGGAVRVEVAAFGYARWTRTYEVVPTEPIRVFARSRPDRPGGDRGQRRRPRRRSDFAVPGRVRHRFPAAQDPAGDPGDGRAAGDRGLPLRLRALRLHLGAVHSGRHQRGYPGAAGRRPALQRLPPGRLPLGDQCGGGGARDDPGGFGRRGHGHRVALGRDRHRHPRRLPRRDADGRLAGPRFVPAVGRGPDRQQRVLPARRPAHLHRRLHAGAQEDGGDFRPSPLFLPGSAWESYGRPGGSPPPLGQRLPQFRVAAGVRLRGDQYAGTVVGELRALGALPRQARGQRDLRREPGAQPLHERPLRAGRRIGRLFERRARGVHSAHRHAALRRRHHERDPRRPAGHLAHGTRHDHERRAGHRVSRQPRLRPHR